jgi:AraC family transcriptional regulator of adaptative response/methylated-DNA-[protein]-cysteine methyltransferase
MAGPSRGLVDKPLKGIHTQGMNTRIIRSPLGDMLAAATEEGISLLAFADGIVPAAPATLGPEAPIFDELERELGEYFDGRRRAFDLPVKTSGSGFQEKAWGYLRGVPYGETASYGQQARAIGQPEAARAVARADGANRVCILIPCHRILGSDGSLTGYSGGIDRKRRLLALEASGQLPT